MKSNGDRQDAATRRDGRVVIEAATAAATRAFVNAAHNAMDEAKEELGQQREPEAARPVCHRCAAVITKAEPPQHDEQRDEQRDERGDNGARGRVRQRRPGDEAAGALGPPLPPPPPPGPVAARSYYLFRGGATPATLFTLGGRPAPGPVFRSRRNPGPGND